MGTAHPTILRTIGLAVCAVLLVLASAVGAYAASDDAATAEPAIEGVRVGIGGAYKAGSWTPVVIVLRGGAKAAAGAVELIVPDGDGAPSRVATPPNEPCRLSPGEVKEITLYARLGRESGWLTARFQVDDGTPIERTFQAGPAADATEFSVAVPSREGVAVLLGVASGGIESAAHGLSPHTGERIRAVRVASSAALPRRWIGYEGVDLVVLGTERPEVYAAWQSDPAGVDALVEWVRMGGTVLVCGGEKCPPLFASGGLLAPLLPGKFQRVQPLRQASSLESYCGSSIAVARQAAGGRIALPCALLSDVTGVIEAREGNLPLLARRALGFGTTLFVAFDLDRPPLDQWPDRPTLVGKLLALPTAASEAVRQADSYISLGYTDLSGQLRSTLDQFSGIPVVPFWAVTAAVLGYLVIVGPLDYFFLRKAVGRMTFTWVTLPLVIIAVSVAAYVASNRLKGDQVRVNRLDLIDVDATTGRVRGAAWAHLFSPKVDQYDLSFAPQASLGAPLRDTRVWAGWLGLPGDALGGMAPRTPSVSPWKTPYDFSPSLDAIRGMPLQMWTTKSLTARWSAESQFRAPSNLTEAAGSLIGDVTNPLDVALEDCLICYGRFAYRLETLEPGQTATLTLVSPRRDLSAMLTGRTLSDSGQAALIHYDRESTDGVYVLRAMMFYNIAGGYRYLGLTNRCQRFVDASDLLRANRAILIGTARGAHGAALLRDGRPAAAPDDRRDAVYRVVFPVGRSSSP